jgi:DNA-binding HxlR family transcriptional regulator
MAAISHTAPVGNPRTEELDCAVNRALTMIAHRWTVQIIYYLHHAPQQTLRFRQLQRAVHPITQKELTKRLRELERAGMVRRTIYPEIPPRVEYQLTQLGSTVVPPLVALTTWAEQHWPEVEANQAAAQHAHPPAE